MKNFIRTTFLSLFCTLFIFCIHTMSGSNSMINFRSDTLNTHHDFISNEYLTIAVDLHKSHPAFAKRPVTTYLTEVLSESTFLNIGESFTFISFLFLFICGILVFYLANAMLNNIRQSNASVILFFLSFTVLFSFFPSIYSYDEPIQYCLVAISLLAILKKNWVIYILSFSIGLIVRESGVLLIPSIAFFLIPIDFKFKNLLSFENIKKGLIILLPVFIYMAYLYLFITMSDIAEESKSDFSDRFSHFIYNFQNQQHSIETFISLFLAIGIQLYLLYWYQVEKTFNASEKKLVKSFLLCLFINTIIVIATTKSRETRLFALPLVFIWPIMGKYFLHELKSFKFPNLAKRFVSNWIYFTCFLILIAFYILFFVHIYKPTGNGRTSNLQDEYLLILMIVMTLHFLVKNFIKKYTNYNAQLPER
jgi:hypothetical protein